ncbi:MAG: anti-sigma factor family protein [bacterium]
MKVNDTEVTEQQLHAYVDGFLDSEQHEKVRLWLQNNPSDAEKVAAWQQINLQLHESLDVADFELQTNTKQPHKRESKWTKWPAIAASFVLGLSISFMSMFNAESNDIEQHLIKPASFAHEVFAAEKKHPVEVSSNNDKHLLAWLSNRLHTQIKAARLDAEGYDWMGGRLLPSSNRMAAQFMYQRADGSRLSLYSRHIDWKQNLSPGLHFSKQENLDVFYWVHQDMAYAVVSILPEKELHIIAADVKNQLKSPALEPQSMSMLANNLR